MRAELQRSPAPVAQRFRFEVAGRESVDYLPAAPWGMPQHGTDADARSRDRGRGCNRLPLDDVFVALKDVIPTLTRSSLHRGLQRHGMSRQPQADREKPQVCKKHEIGHFHIDIAALRFKGGKGIRCTLAFFSVMRRLYRHRPAWTAARLAPK